MDHSLTLECFLETKLVLYNLASLATVASTGNTWLQLGQLHWESGIKRQKVNLKYAKFSVVINHEFLVGWKSRKSIFTQINEQMFGEDRKCFLYSSSS